MCLAVPGRIVNICGSALARWGAVNFGGVTKEVSLAFLPDAKVGNYVMVHVGFALSVVNEDEALKTLEYLRQMDEAKA
jgi:hydrogenase expression/formation protein HypC